MAEVLQIQIQEQGQPGAPDPARLALAQQEAAEAWAETLRLQKKATTSALTATPAFSPTGPRVGPATPDQSGPLSETPKERSEQLFEILRASMPQPKSAAPEPPGPTDLQRDYAEAARKAVEQAERGASFKRAQVAKGPEPVPEGLEEADTPEVERVDPAADARRALAAMGQRRRQEEMQRQHEEDVRQQMRRMSPDFRRDDDERIGRERETRDAQDKRQRSDDAQRQTRPLEQGAQLAAQSGHQNIATAMGAAGNIAKGVASKDPVAIGTGIMQLAQLQEDMRKQREEDRRQKVEFIGKQMTRAAALDPGQFGDLAQQGLSRVKEWGPALSEAVKQTRNFGRALESTFNTLAPTNAQMAQTKAMIEVRDILKKIERGDRLAAGLSAVADAQNRIENAIKDIQTGVVKPFLKPFAAILGKVADLLEDIAKRMGAKDADEVRKAGEALVNEFMSTPDDFFPERGVAGAAPGTMPVGGGR